MRKILEKVNVISWVTTCNPTRKRMVGHLESESTWRPRRKEGPTTFHFFENFRGELFMSLPPWITPTSIGTLLCLRLFCNACNDTNWPHRVQQFKAIFFKNKHSIHSNNSFFDVSKDSFWDNTVVLTKIVLIVFALLSMNWMLRCLSYDYE